MQASYDVVIIGAGIAGLSAAYALQQQGKRVCVLESTARVGGVLHSERIDGYLCEWGANTFQKTATTLRTLARAVGCAQHTVKTAPDARARYVLRNGTLHEVPAGGPRALLGSQLLSWRGKWRVLAELRNRSRATGNESVGDFIARRFGTEVRDHLADPFISGIFAGDVNTLELASAFPQLLAWEQQHGSLLRAMQHSTPRHRSSALYAFANGMDTLCAALGAALGDALQLNSTVDALQYQPHAPRYRLRVMRQGRIHDLAANWVIVATPAPAAAALVRPLSPTLAQGLQNIPYAPLAVIQLGYQVAAHTLPNGFGFLVPGNEQRSILGCLFASRLFPNRAPNDHQLLTVFMGGARQPHLVDQFDALCAAQAHAELCTLLGLPSGALQFSAVRKHARAIPQYTMGHRARLQQIATALRPFPGLYLTGNYLDGTSVNATIEHAQGIAERIAAVMRSTVIPTAPSDDTATERVAVL